MCSLDGVMHLIERAHRIAVTCHVNPDGDAIGSLLAMQLGLKTLGKACEAFCHDPVPGYLSFLPGAELVRLPDSLTEGESFDLLISLDTATLDRMGDCQSLRERAAVTVQLDHHETNTRYLQHNYVEGDAPAAGMIVLTLLERMGVILSRDMATCLYAAISTDTGNLGFNSTTPEAFFVMGRLVEAGLPLSQINRLLFRQREKPQLAILGRALQSLQYHHNGEIASMYLTQADFAACNAGPEHADSVVNYGLDVIGVKMAVLARELPEGGRVKLSVRSVAPARVDGVAMRWNGGGHAQAAGMIMEGELLACVQACVAAMAEELDGVNA